MIVCHCEVVSDRRIRAEVEAGSRTVDEISERCGAGTHCGSCRPTIGVLLATVVAADQVEPAA
jgi:bacterioferritin-associated ferredoxin